MPIWRPFSSPRVNTTSKGGGKTIGRNRRLRFEPCEKRLLFAIGPSLVAVIPNVGQIIQSNDVLSVAPTQLTFRFTVGETIDPTTLSAIQITRAGPDGVLGTADDVVVTTGFLGIGDNPNEVIARFLNSLPDDEYQIKIVGSGSSPLKDTGGNAFNGGADDIIDFRLDFGPQVVSVVPQPISRNAQGHLTQSVNEVDVYFNDDPLTTASANNPANYELINTNDTATTTDDTTIVPASAVYSSANNEVVLMFAPGVLSTAATYRLRIGNNNQTATPVTPAVGTAPGASDYPGDSFATSDNLGNVFTGPQGLQSLIVSSTIVDNSITDPNPNTEIFPGGPNEPGARVSTQPGATNVDGPADTTDGIPIIPYNFQTTYGYVNGVPQVNVITPQQEDDARQALSYFSYYAGVEFEETANQGITIATGDMRADDPKITADDTGPPAFADPDGPLPTDPTSSPNVQPLLVSGPDNTMVFNTAATPSVIVNNSYNWGNSETGGLFFQSIMGALAQVLGVGYTEDLPAPEATGSQDDYAGVPGALPAGSPLITTVVGDTSPGSVPPGTTPAAEPIFPGDADKMYLQYLYRPDSRDINIYQFNLTQDGTLSLETIAQRLPTPSELNSVITLYDADGNIVARNDNYFGNDSFVQLPLTSGTYYVAVSSTGNTNFNPNVPNSGMGGTTEGPYQLRLNFTPNSSSGLTDTNGALLDGDANGQPGPGGTYNFWFKVQDTAHTIYVDKVASGGSGPQGSLTNPYTTISAALAAATSGDVVRIEGNGTVTGASPTAVSYNIGFDTLGNPLSDGSTMEIPQGVTVMIDAGALIKLRAANIDVGSSAQGLDRSEGALQVLGTPTKSVYFTSYNNETLGLNANPLVATPSPGDWGGLVFRADADQAQNGIFLDYVNNANLTYGGGSVTVNSVKSVYDPIHLISSRPTITYDSISHSADAAMSADPNSFEISEFQDSTDTADYGRVGPDIYGNTVVNNSINGMFIRIDTEAGQNLNPLTVSARLDATDIVYVLQENLEIQGNEGGINDTTGQPQARMAGSLVIDPGVIVKLFGARIETGIGAQLLAEGTDSNPVVFTSLNDDRYGAGGSFDTTNNGVTSGSPGDWGGLFFGPLSTGSIDYALITFGGGTTTIEGGFAQFNAVEIHQAVVRIADSVLEDNDTGSPNSNDTTTDGTLDGDDRNGRSWNSEATIFVRGAQPIIVGDTIEDNNGPAISIDLNSLNNILVNDPGRSTGAIDFYGSFPTNYGPLVHGNLIGNNAINGMVVRGGILTTDGIWDDTDIVHVVENAIVVPDQNSLSGTLRLESTSTASLVVKLLGAHAGFTASGDPLDITDRIGGSLQLIGTPGYPVVLTSLADDTEGAGLTPNGTLDDDTNNDGSASSPAPGDWAGVTIDDFSNDRNVEVINESEQSWGPNGDTNNTPATAQVLGSLAPNENSGDDNLRLGFEVHGSISQPNDVDVYSFQATAGTDVWFDMSQTSSALDSVLELVDANGSVIAGSNDSQAEQANPGLLVGSSPMVQPLQPGALFGAPDFFSENPKDAGMQVVLPGTVGTTNTYYIRVRSNPQPTNPFNDLTGGLTQGVYVLQIRLSDVYEFPGSVIRDTDINYAVNGVQIIGKPEHSPLEGESASSSVPHTTLATAQNLGDLLTTDLGTLSVAGNLTIPTGQTEPSVDWYTFTLDYDLLGALDTSQSFAAMFDIDYADGLSRPDTTISVFDSKGDLIYISRNSDVIDDQPVPDSGADESDLSTASFSTGDPFIGTVQLPAGAIGQDGTTGTSDTYYVAVSSNDQLPSVLDANFNSAAFDGETATDPLVRLEPIDSLNRVVDDRVGSAGVATDDTSGSEQIFPGTTPAQLNSFATPFTLNDVNLFVDSPTTLSLVNALTGGVETQINPLTTPLAGNYGDLAMRNDGELYAYTQGPAGMPTTDLDSGNYTLLDTGDGAETTIGNDGISTYVEVPGTPPTWTLADDTPPTAQGVGMQFDAMTFNNNDGTVRQLYAVGHRLPGEGVTNVTNLLYTLDPNTGMAIPVPNPQGAAGTGPNYPSARQLITGPTLIASNASSSGGTAGDVVDGQQFQINSGTGGPVTFEMDSGPEIDLNASGGLNIRSGDSFELAPTGSTPVTFQFLSGNVINVEKDFTGFPTDGSAKFSVTGTGGSATFQFLLTGGTASPGLIPIFLNAGDTTPAIVAQTIEGAISGAGIGVTAAIPAGGTGTRITLTGDVPNGAGNSVTGVTANLNSAMQIQGSAVASGADIGVPFEETDPTGTVGKEIASAVNNFYQGVITANWSGAQGGTRQDRVTFANASIAAGTDLSGLPQDFTYRAGTDSGVSAGAVAVEFKPSDTSVDLATDIADAINGEYSPPTFIATATAEGSDVDILGSTAINLNSPPITDPLPQGTFGGFSGFVLDPVPPALAGPGGNITGIAIPVNNNMYAVSDMGGLYEVNNYAESNPTTNFIATIDNNGVPIQFSGLTAGPPDLQGGYFANMLFATDTDGNLYCVNPATGTLLPVFQDSNGNPTTSINTGVPGAVGLAFSPLDYNLWHVTDARANNAGHGFAEAPDGAAAIETPTGIIPARTNPLPGLNESYYFGLENPKSPSTISDQPGAENYSTNPNISNYQNYNLPGGAEGTLVSDTFSLAGYSAADMPTLYFDYFLQTQGADSVVPNPLTGVDMLDSFRVYVSNDVNADASNVTDGSIWSEVATNNDILTKLPVGNTAAQPAELPAYLSAQGGTYAGEPANQKVQLLFDGTNSWRQARIDLGDFAGDANLRLMFVFSTAGSLNEGLQGDQYGSYNTSARGQANNFEGAYIDDFVVGFADRGEMVTDLNNGLGNSNFFTTPANPDPTATKEILQGAYQLEIRPGTSYGVAYGLSLLLEDSFDTNDRQTQAISLVAPSAAAVSDSSTQTDDVYGSLYSGSGSGMVFDLPSAPASATSATLTLTVSGADLGSALKYLQLDGGPGVLTHKFFTSDGANGADATESITLTQAQLNNLIAANGDNGTMTFDVTPTSDVMNLGSSSLTLTLSYTATPGLNGQTFQVYDGLHVATYEFIQSTGGVTLTPGDVAIDFTGTETAPQIAALMVTAINGNTNSLVKASAIPTSARVNLFGALAIENSTDPDLQVLIFDDSDLGLPLMGDENVPREQGYTIVQSNRILNSSQNGIAVMSGPRSIPSLPRPGSPRNLVNLNSNDLVPGVTLVNNLITGAATGINWSGDAGTDPIGAVLFGRIINNTIYGSTGVSGVGIQVATNSSPTILNNILANLTSGITVDASSSTTVVGEELYQGDMTNLTGVSETNAIDLQPTDPLFVDPTHGDFYLAEGSKAIDSSLNSLQDRPAMTSVTAPIGIPPSPILAPKFDLLGQLRVDDPNVPSPPGLGQNVFIDRGAIDRADFTGPTAVLITPADNGPLDSNPAVNIVQVANSTLNDFDVQIQDGNGTGADDAAINSNQFALTFNGKALVEGTDYLFSYDATDHVAHFTAIQGVWLSGTYTITLDNSGANAITDLAGNLLKPNNTSGTTLFTIVLSSTPIAPWQNPTNALDVNADGIVDTLDALIVINSLNALGVLAPLPSPASAPSQLINPATNTIYYVDTNGDGDLTPADVIQVINFLNSSAGGAITHSTSVLHSTTVTSALAAPSTSTATSASPNPVADQVVASTPAVTTSTVVLQSVNVGSTSAGTATGSSVTVAASSNSTAPSASTAPLASTATVPLTSTAVSSAIADDNWDPKQADLEDILSGIAASTVQLR